MEKKLRQNQEAEQQRKIITINDAINNARKFLHPYPGAAEFVHSNPFESFEKTPFFDALVEINHYFGQETLPDLEDLLVFYKQGKFTKEDVAYILRQRKLKISPEDLILEDNYNSKNRRTIDQFRDEEDELTLFIDRLITQVYEQTDEIKIAEQDWQEEALRDLNTTLSQYGRFYTASQLFHLLTGDWKILKALNWQMDEVLGRFFDRGVQALPYFNRKQGLLDYWLEHEQARLIPIFRYGINGEFLSIPDYQNKIKALKGKTAEEIIISCFEELGIEEQYWEEYLKRMMAEQPGWFSAVLGEEKEGRWYPFSLADVFAIRIFYEKEFFREEVKKFNWPDKKSGLHNYFAENLGEWYVRRNTENPFFSRPSALERLKLKRIHGREDFPPEIVSYMPYEYREWYNQLPTKEKYNLLALLQYNYLNHQIIRELQKERNSYQINDFLRRVILFEAMEYHRLREVISRLISQEEHSSSKPEIILVHCMDERTSFWAEKARNKLGNNSFATFGVPGNFGIDSDRIKIKINKNSKVLKLGELIDRLSEESPLFLFLFSFIQLPRKMMELIAQSLFPNQRAEVIEYLQQLLKEGEISIEDNFNLEEKVDIIYRFLKQINFSPVEGKKQLIVIQGHGSTSQNNPLEAAHQCGACRKGRDGFYNALLLALWGNDPEIKRQLKEKYQINLEEVAFLATFFDTAKNQTEVPHQSIPNKFQDLVEQYLNKAREVDLEIALERIKNLPGAPKTKNGKKAQKHTKTRAIDMKEAIPELGHAGAHIVFIGSNTPSFEDGTAFNISWHENQGIEKLKEIMLGSLKIALGIIFEYYFSRVDPHGPFSGGNKANYNPVGLTYVRSGIQSDIRIGLPWQMTASHVPYRPIVIIEASIELIRSLLEKEPEVLEIFRYGWNHLLIIENNQIFKFDPESEEFIKLS